MKRLGSRRVKWLGGVLALSMMLVSFLANSVQTDQDKQKVTTMTDKMKTVCVGRFLIDLPAQAQFSIERGFVGSFNISSSVHETDEEFDVRFGQLEKDVADPIRDIHPPKLESSSTLALPDARAKVVIYNRERRRYPEGGRMVEFEDVSIESILRIGGMTINAGARHRTLDVGARLERTLRQIRPLRQDEIPTEKGFCINRAIVRDPFEHVGNESVVMFAGIPGHPDVNIVLSSMAGTDPAPGLLARHARNVERQPVFVRMAFSPLRENPRSINGLIGDELVLRVREPNFSTGYSFEWQMAGRQDDIYAPLLTFELMSGVNPAAGGKPLQSTLSEEAMFELWERIVSTIRVRPTSIAGDSAALPSGVALGTNAFAGQACPLTGWWACSDGGNGVGVFGGQRQFVTQGRRMPQALLLPPQTMWQRLRGLQPSYESTNPTVWVLADRRQSERSRHTAELEAAVPGQQSARSARSSMLLAHAEPAIGRVVNTGELCPASGWWRCEHGEALDGARWFAAGSALPAATFRAPVRDHGHRQPPFLRRRSAWHLMRVCEDDPELANSGHDAAAAAGSGGSGA